MPTGCLHRGSALESMSVFKGSHSQWHVVSLSLQCGRCIFSLKCTKTREYFINLFWNQWNMPYLFQPTKPVVSQLKGPVGFAGGQSRLSPINPSCPGTSFRNCLERIKNLPTYGDTKSFCMRKAETPHRYHRILCMLQSSKMSNTTNMECFQKVS